MALCLVTGGAGFIGSHVVEALLDRGDKVRVLDSFYTGRRENLADVWDQIDVVEGDLRDIRTVRRAAKGVELVFHLAAMVSVPESMIDPLGAEAVNAGGTLNVLTAAREAGVRRLVLSSTCAVYGDEPTLPKVESQRPAPKSPYAVAKLAAEGYCQVFNESFGVETVVLRYFNVYGPRQDPSSPYSGVISIFVDKISQGQAPTIFGAGQQTRDFVYVGDVAQANLLAGDVSEAAGRILNIGRAQQISINHLFEQLNSLLHTNLEAIRAPARNGDIEHSCADASLANQVLGWRANVPLEEGLRQLLVATLN
jgi:UDP-glucose 4-epimerase